MRNNFWINYKEYKSDWNRHDMDLSKIGSIDLSLAYWADRFFANPIVSFGFEDGRYISFSVEPLVSNEKYNLTNGFLKRYGLMILVAEERDVFSLHANVRNEKIFMYRLNISQENMQILFLHYAYLAAKNEYLSDYYNEIFSGYKTIIFPLMQKVNKKDFFDWRWIVSGYLPDYLRIHGGLNSIKQLDIISNEGNIKNAVVNWGDESEEYKNDNKLFSKRIRRFLD